MGGTGTLYYESPAKGGAAFGLRFPDPTCNPYLAFSVMLSAGLDGVENKTPVPDPVTMDLYEATPAELEELKIVSLPHDLHEAVHVAAHSEFLKGALGDHVHEKLIDTKRAEIDKFRLHVSQFDLQEHLKL